MYFVELIKWGENETGFMEVRGILAFYVKKL